MFFISIFLYEAINPQAQRRAGSLIVSGSGVLALSLFDQFHPAILSLSFLCIVKYDGCKGGHTIGLQSRFCLVPIAAGCSRLEQYIE